MKDYELDKSKKGLFILNYEIKGNKIIVNYANGDSVIIPWTEKNEHILNGKMKTQVQNANNYEKNCKNNFVIYAVLCIIGITVSIPCVKTIIDPSAMLTTIGSCVLGGGTGIAVFSGIEMIIINKYLKDVKKNKKFLEIESEINSKVKENENMLYNTHKVTKNIVKNTPENRVVFTINNVDKVPFSDLEQIMSNIEREEKFNFEYPEVVEEKVKSKTK